MTLRLTLTVKVILLFVLFAALLLVGMGGLAYYSGREALRAAVTSDLLSRANEKEAAVRLWVGEGQAQLGSLAAALQSDGAMAALTAAGPHAATAQAVRDRMVAVLQPWIGAGGYLELFVMAADSGKVMASTDAGEEGKFKEDRPYFLHGKTGPYVQNPYHSLKRQGPAMTVSLPLRSPDGRVLGVLAGRLNLNDMNAIIARRTGVHRTDEAYLVNTSRLFITQPRRAADPIVLQRGVHTEHVKRCLAGESGVILAQDYRDVPAIVAYRWLSDLEVCLIAKVDQAEAFGPTQAFARTLLAVGAFVLVGASGLAVVLARNITGPIQLLQSGAARFGQGDLTVRLPDGRRDELGRLAEAFNTMATALSEKEAQLRQRADQLEAANKELEAFSYSVSHDLRAPLRAMDGFSRILVEEYGPRMDPNAQRYLNLVRDNSKQMGRLVDDLLSFSRLGRQAPKLQPVLPAELVRQALEDLQSEQAGRRVEISVGDLPACQADPALLKQVFVNLLSNALKFTRKREVARIEVGTLGIEDCKLQIADFPDPAVQSAISNLKSAIYFVRDNGVGFDIRYAHKLFGVFQRLHRAEEYEGTGVGLAIVQRIIHRHGGRVWAEAEVEKGATFYFTIAN